MKFIMVFIIACWGSLDFPMPAGRDMRVWMNWNTPAMIGRILYGSASFRLSSQRNPCVQTSEKPSALPEERFEIAR